MSAALHHTGPGRGPGHVPPAADLADLIGQSHRRSQGYGLSTGDEPDFSSPGRVVLQEALAENRFLFQHAAPVMETLYDQIVNTHSMVLLTSARGMVLHTLGACYLALTALPA